MEASIIILTKDAGNNFGRLLQRISSQKFSQSYEVLVIDSGSTDDTLAITRDFPVKIFQIRPDEFHHGRTRNLGAELATGRILVYITQDALPLDDQWLEKLTRDFDDLSVAMVVGRQIPWENTKPPEKFFYAYSFPERRIRVSAADSDYFRDNIFISNVNSAIRRDAWHQFRFSESIIMAEDKEFAKRLLRAGWSILYEPEAAVYHAHDYSISSLLMRSIDTGVALSQGVNVPRSRHWVVKRLGYFAKEARYLASHKQWWKWLPYSVAYEVCKLLGVCLGWMKQKLGRG